MRNWEFAGCVDTCPERLESSLQGMTLDIEPDAVTVGEERRTYDVTLDRSPALHWRYDDDGTEEKMTLVGDDVFIGHIVTDEDDFAVRFVRRELREGRTPRVRRAGPRRSGTVTAALRRERG